MSQTGSGPREGRRGDQHTHAPAGVAHGNGGMLGGTHTGGTVVLAAD